MLFFLVGLAGEDLIDNLNFGEPLSIEIGDPFSFETGDAAFDADDALLTLVLLLGFTMLCFFSRKNIVLWAQGAVPLLKDHHTYHVIQRFSSDRWKETLAII
jgi:hypothetical protein